MSENDGVIPINQLLPHPELAPQLRPGLTMGQCVAAWLEVMDWGDGSAVGAWKHVRVTHDVDLLVEGTRREYEPILKPLARAGIHPKRDPPVLIIDAHAIIPLKYEPPDTYLDIRIGLLLAETAFQKQALSRRVRFDLPRAGIPAAVLACEDLILFKLLAGRIIDQADVAALLRINEDRLDWGYLNKEADQLGFQEVLHRLRLEAGLES